MSDRNDAAGLLGNGGLADRLRDAFLTAGYTPEAVVTALGPAAHDALTRGEVVLALRATAGGSALETLIRTFLIGTAEPVRALRSALGPAYSAAVDEGLLTGGDPVRATLDVRPYGRDGWWVVSDTGGTSTADHVPGVGGASRTLAEATVPIRVGCALDIGTGCGVQALHLSERSPAVTGTDRNPRALAAARATVQLSGVDLELLTGDLYAPVAGRRFDLIVSNPPFVVSPAGGYTYRDSGLAGDEVGRRLVRGAAAHLTEGGWCQLLANWLHLRGRDWRERVAGWLEGTGCDAWVVQREVSAPAQYAELWLRDSGDAAGAPWDPSYRARYEDWVTAFDRDGVEGIGLGVITLRRVDAADPAVRIEDLRQEVEAPFGAVALDELLRGDALRGRSVADLLDVRFRSAPGLTLEQVAGPSPEGWQVERRILVQAGGARRQAVVDPVVAALVAGCTGEVRLAELTAVLTAVYGDDLTERLVAAARALSTDGFLLPPSS